MEQLVDMDRQVLWHDAQSALSNIKALTLEDVRRIAAARRLALVWGVHPVPFKNAQGVTEMVEHACTAVVTHGFAEPGDDIVVVAGLPFGLSGSTNLLHIAHIS